MVCLSVIRTALIRKALTVVPVQLDISLQMMATHVKVALQGCRYQGGGLDYAGKV